MTVAPATTASNQKTPWLPIAAAAILSIVDSVCKAIVLAHPDLENKGFISFSLFRNEGIAFSLPFRGLLFWITALPIFVGVCIAAVVAYRLQKNRLFMAFIFVILGAASNIFDRLTHGAVIDYLIFFRVSAVNIADGMIVGGILAAIFLNYRKEA